MKATNKTAEKVINSFVRLYKSKQVCPSTLSIAKAAKVSIETVRIHLIKAAKAGIIGRNKKLKVHQFFVK